MTKHQLSAVGETTTRVRGIGWRTVQGREQRWGTEAVIESAWDAPESVYDRRGHL